MPMRLTVCIALLATMAPLAVADTHTQGAADTTDRGGQVCCFTVQGDVVEVLIAPTRDAVRRIQAELAVRGFDPGQIDGVMGPRTERALRSFQRREGLVEGLVSVETLERLHIRVAAGQSSAPVPLAPPAPTQETDPAAETLRADPARMVPAPQALPSEPERLPNYTGPNQHHTVEKLHWPGKSPR